MDSSRVIDGRLVCTALLMGLLLVFYILYEIIYGLLHFRL
jgi:hypothetical protein